MLADLSAVNIDVSDQCQFLKIGDNIYHLSGSTYLDVIVPPGWTDPVLDETYKIAIYDGGIWEYSQTHNRYYGKGWMNADKPLLQDIQVYLNQDKLIILSSTTNAASPPVSQYRVHCAVSNGTSWNLIDVIDGSSINGPPKIEISPNY